MQEIHCSWPNLIFDKENYRIQGPIQDIFEKGDSRESRCNMILSQVILPRSARKWCFSYLQARLTLSRPPCSRNASPLLPLLFIFPSFYALPTHRHLVVSLKTSLTSCPNPHPHISIAPYAFLSSLSIAILLIFVRLFDCYLYFLLESSMREGVMFYFAFHGLFHAKNTEWVLRSLCWIIEWRSLFDILVAIQHVSYSLSNMLPLPGRHLSSWGPSLSLWFTTGQV